MMISQPKIRRGAAIAGILIGALAASGVGCESMSKSESKAAAQAQWATARSNVLVSLAADQYATGNFDKSRQTANDGLRLDPTNVQLHILLAKLDLEQNQLEQAEAHLNQAQTFDKKNAEADYLLGVICQRWRKPEKALACYAAAVTKNPNELAYLLAQAETLASLDRCDEALSLLQQKVIYFEHSGVIRDEVGQLMLRKGQFADAVDMLRQATILSADDETIKAHLASAYYQGKQYREAAELLGRLTREGAPFEKRSDLWLMLGECQLQINGRASLVDARSSFESAAQLAPANANAWASVAKAAIRLEDLKRADLALSKALSLEPDAAQSYLLLGYLRSKQNRNDDALAALKKAHELDPRDPTCLSLTGQILEKQGNTPAALRFYAAALRLKPGDPLASQLMASVDANQ